MFIRHLFDRKAAKMASKKNQKKSDRKPLPGIIAGAVTLLLFLLIFGLNSALKIVIGLGLSALIGWAVSVMSTGLDTSKPAPEQRKEVIPQTGNERADQLITAGQELMSAIRRENDLITDVDLTEKINTLDATLHKIFLAVADEPEKAAKIRRSIDYYLPTTLKMLTGYRQLDQRNVRSEDAEKLRDQIRQGMDMVVSAFQKQLETLYQAEILDISTDIEVLDTILKSEGLLESDFKPGASAQGQTTAGTN